MTQKSPPQAGQSRAAAVTTTKAATAAEAVKETTTTAVDTAAETTAASETTAHRHLLVIDACNLIIKNGYRPSLSNCIKHARECRYRCLAGYSNDDIKIQVLHILNNMSYWRTKEARVVRETLRQFMREH